MPGCPSLLAPLLLILLLVPTCRPQVGSTGALGDVTLFGGNRSGPVRSASLILMDPAAEASTAADVTAGAETTALAVAAPAAPANKDDDTIMIQYRRFQRPQRRDLPVGLFGADAEKTSPGCELFLKDEPMASDRRAIVFMSPGYPGNYPNNTDCVRRLTVDAGYLLQLDFRDKFHIEPSSGDCHFDYLEVRDGAHGYSPLRGRFCGQAFPPILTSTDRYLWLRFHSDDNIEYGGFKAVYRAVPRPEHDVPPPMEMCFFNVTGSQGYINRTDIDVQEPFRVNMSLEHKMPLDCMWIIWVPEGYKIMLNFIDFKLEKPNDCESNFVDVFPKQTDLDKRLKNFCGSIADSITSSENVLHIRFYADYSARNSCFTSLFTAFRETTNGGACDPDTESDCQDNTCINKTLWCNGAVNCRFKWDEEDCKPKSGSFADVIASSEQLIIIMVIFCMLVFGMCFAFVYNCIGKLLRDHRIIQEHMRQSREGRLDEMGRKSPTVSRHCSQHSSEHEHELGAEDTPTARRHHQDCYLAGTDDAMLPMLLSRGALPTPPSNGDAIFVRGAGGEVHDVRTHSVGCGSVVMADVEDDSDALPSAPLPLPPPLPEMRDMECQTRESLFHGNGSSLSHSSHHEPLTSRSNSERSCTPPPPPPPTISRLVNMKNSRNAPRPAPFSTFGYVDDNVGGAATLSRRGPPPAPGPPHHHHHHRHLDRHEDPGMRFRAEAVIEMDQKSSSSSAGGGGGVPGAPGADRPFSMDSTKSAPDVIVTH